jgi:hypothetical protein
VLHFSIGFFNPSDLGIYLCHKIAFTYYIYLYAQKILGLSSEHILWVYIDISRLEVS